MRALFLALLTMALLFPLSVSARTWHVPSEAPTIQAGIDSAGVGDTVLVACGTYYEHDIVLKSGICLRSESGEASCVTVDAQQMGRVFYCGDTSDTVVVGGLTITGGYQFGEYARGGGMYLQDASLAFMRCAVVGNSAGGYMSGGGGIDAWECSLYFEDCTIADNGGGGVYTAVSNVTFINCTFSGNTDAGGLTCIGSPAIPTSATLLGCVFTGNSGLGGAGAYFGPPPVPLGARDTGSVSIEDCLFTDNVAFYHGGGLWIWEWSAEIARCTFSRNAALDSYGGGIQLTSSSAEIRECTIVNNSAGWRDGGAGVYCATSEPSIFNAIVAFNNDGEAILCNPEWPCFPSLSCCDLYGNAGGDWVGCIEDQYGINGNISEDPLFCDPENGDFTLQEISPCAPGQQPDCGLIGALGVGCGPTATVPTTWGLAKSLFELPGGR